MQEFAINDTSAELIFTLTEKVTIEAPNYLFVFKHVTTKDVVAFVKSEDDDESPATGRYNLFTINPSEVFADQQVGQWNYTIYEQEDNTNTDPALAGNILEYGKLILNRAVDFAFDKYEQTTSFKTYNG